MLLLTYFMSIFFLNYFSTWVHVFYEECGLCLVASFTGHVEMQTHVHILAYLVELGMVILPRPA